MKLERINQVETGTLFRITVSDVTVEDVRRAEAYDPSCCVLTDDKGKAFFKVQATAAETTISDLGVNLGSNQSSETGIVVMYERKEADPVVRDAKMQRTFNNLETVMKKVTGILESMKKVEIANV